MSTASCKVYLLDTVRTGEGKLRYQTFPVMQPMAVPSRMRNAEEGLCFLKSSRNKNSLPCAIGRKIHLKDVNLYEHETVVQRARHRPGNRL